jgi:arginase family enzyme
MALAIVSERHVPPDRILLGGVRDLDPLEAERVAKSRMQVIPSARLPAASLPKGPLYVHIDVDVLNPELSPGVNFHGEGGLHPSELEEAVLTVIRGERVAALNIANYNPGRDMENRTLHIICDLIRCICANIPEYELHTTADSR